MKKAISVALFSLSLIPGMFAQGNSYKSAGFSEKFIQLPTGVKLEYVEQGDLNGIPVILLHGFSDSWHSFEQVLPFMPGNFHVFAISQRGHGNSSRPLAGYHTNDFAKDIAAFIQKKNLGPAIIVGHSMGSTVAQGFAARYPSLAKAVVLVSTFANYDKPMITEFKTVIDALADPVDSIFVAEFQKSTVTKPIPEEQLNTYISESRKLPAYVWKGVAAGWSTSDYRKSLESFSKPTLILWGDKDAYCPREDQDLLNKAIKNSTLTVYEGIGHAPHWEDPKRVANDLIAFIEKARN